jgi:hypothetical protein
MFPIGRIGTSQRRDCEDTYGGKGNPDRNSARMTQDSTEMIYAPFGSVVASLGCRCSYARRIPSFAGLILSSGIGANVAASPLPRLDDESISQGQRADGLA